MILVINTSNYLDQCCLPNNVFGITVNGWIQKTCVNAQRNWLIWNLLNLSFCYEELVWEGFVGHLRTFQWPLNKTLAQSKNCILYCMLGEKWKNCTLIWYYPCHLHDFVMLEYHWHLFFASFADFDILFRPNRCGARSAHWRISYSSEFWSLKDQPRTQSKETVDSWIFTFNTREPEVL